MRLDDILRSVSRLTAEELQQLRDYLDRVPEKPPRLSPEERMRRLNAAFEALGEGFSPAELENLVVAMTGESSEPSEASFSDRRF